MYFWLAILILIVLYIIVRIRQSSKESKIRRHGLCCDECKIRHLCDKYKNKTNL